MPFSIVPQVVEIAKESGTPVIAGGGITTGRHLAASIALGAAGVWTGTVWLTSRESDVSMHIKEKLLAAGKPPLHLSPFRANRSQLNFGCDDFAALHLKNVTTAHLRIHRLDGDGQTVLDGFDEDLGMGRHARFQHRAGDGINIW